MKTWIGISFLVCMTAVFAYTDIKQRKVYNKHLCFMITGAFIISFMNGHIIMESILGLILPFGLHYIPFKLRLISAGDVKIFMVLGLALGIVEIIDIMVLSYLIGGAMSFVILMKEKVLLTRLRYIYCYMTTLLIAGTQYEYSPEASKAFQLPFAVAIHMALVLKTLHCYKTGF